MARDKMEAMKGSEEEQIAEATVVENKVKAVKIRVYEDTECTIGGNIYSIKKDGEAKVPEDVAAILVTAKKAYRL